MVSVVCRPGIHNIQTSWLCSRTNKLKYQHQVIPGLAILFAWSDQTFWWYLLRWCLCVMFMSLTYLQAEGRTVAVRHGASNSWSYAFWIKYPIPVDSVDSVMWCEWKQAAKNISCIERMKRRKMKIVFLTKQKLTVMIVKIMTGVYC